MKKTVALHNLGCKVNAYEMEAMEQMLAEAGYEIVPCCNSTLYHLYVLDSLVNQIWFQGNQNFI